MAQLPLNIPIIITGDFNVNILSDNSKLISLMAHHDFRQCLSDPTTDYGSALDHVYSNQFNVKTNIDVHDVYYSNHDAVDQSEK